MSQPALRIVEGSSMDKSKALSAALSQIERQFGKGSVMRLGKNDKSMDVETISTGSLGLDIALGVGGLPRGRVVEIYGPESSGKTTLALHCLAEAQKKGGICAFIDAEHALDPIYASKLGVKVEDLLVSQPDYGEQALEIVHGAVFRIDGIIIGHIVAVVGEGGKDWVQVERIHTQRSQVIQVSRDTSQISPIELHHRLPAPGGWRFSPRART